MSHLLTPKFQVTNKFIEQPFRHPNLSKKRRASRKGAIMETRVALIGIMVENPDSVGELNQLLHEYGSYIIGRMGIPYKERGINIISVAIDAPQDKINALSGKIGRLDGISAKTVYSNLKENK